MFPRTTPRARTALALGLALALLTGGSPAHADEPTTVEVSAVVRGEMAPTLPLPDVIVSVWRWVDLEGEWEQVLDAGNDDATGPDGRFSLELETGASYTLMLSAPSDYPSQYLGGGPTAPANPGSADWSVATFVPGEVQLPEEITLLTSAAFSVAGSALGDEDEVSLTGWAELYDLARTEDSLVAVTDLDASGGFVLHGLREGATYAVRVSAEGYLPTYLGDTTQPELATAYTPVGASSALEPVSLRRGAALGGVVTFDGTPVELVHVLPSRWDPAGARWLAPEHYSGLPTDTADDGAWNLSLEPGARYTLFFDTSDAPGAPPSQYLGGGSVPPAPTDPAATFALAPSGHTVDVTLVEPARPEPPVVEPVEKGTSTTTLSLSAPSAKFGAKVTATVLVRATRGTPSGTITLRLDGKVVATVRPTVSGTSATAKVTVPRTAKAGTHRLVATAGPSSSVSGSTSAAATLRVTKAKAKVTVKGPARWRLARGKRPSLSVKVTGTKGGPVPAGKITVTFGKKKVTKTLKAGKVKVRGPRLKARGKVKISVTFKPSAKTYAKPKAVKKTLRVR
ncbi:MAG: Ig-like domain-containing protein [Actinomycetota bacterium]|nr:Ig-like domain-containing protein [Actinomycetota bacterium]